MAVRTITRPDGLDLDSPGRRGLLGCPGTRQHLGRSPDAAHGLGRARKPGPVADWWPSAPTTATSTRARWPSSSCCAKSPARTCWAGSSSCRCSTSLGVSCRHAREHGRRRREPQPRLRRRGRQDAGPGGDHAPHRGVRPRVHLAPRPRRSRPAFRRRRRRGLPSVPASIRWTTPSRAGRSRRQPAGSERRSSWFIRT